MNEMGRVRGVKYLKVSREVIPIGRKVFSCPNRDDIVFDCPYVAEAILNRGNAGATWRASISRITAISAA